MIATPTSRTAVCAAVLLSSAYGFSQSAAKVRTSDYFFTGFPSYWNIVAWYLYLCGLSAWLNAAVLVAFAVLVFVPLRYVYPSRTQALSGLTMALGATWACLAVWITWRLPVQDGPWLALSFVFPVYYFALSLWLDRRSRRAERM